jgi:hypothetical protein
MIQGDTQAHQAIQASCGAEAQLGSLAYVDKIYSDPCWAQPWGKNVFWIKNRFGGDLKQVLL